MKTLYAIAAGTLRRYFKIPPNVPYLRFIRRFPCLVCAATRGVEAAHTGPHGLGQKSPDESALPLCAVCHWTGNNSYHKLGPVGFQEFHGRDIADAVAFFNHMWQQKQGRPAVAVEVSQSEDKAA